MVRTWRSCATAGAPALRTTAPRCRQGLRQRRGRCPRAAPPSAQEAEEEQQIKGGRDDAAVPGYGD